MTIKDVKKYLFMGVNAQRDEFFKKAQYAGIIHFIDTKAKKAVKAPQEIIDINLAIKILRGLPTLEQEEPARIEKAGKIVERILELHNLIASKEEELRVINLEKMRLQVFGDFNLDDIAYIEKESGRKVQFFCAKPSVREDWTLPVELLYVGYDHGLDYYISFNKEKTHYDGLVEMHFDESLSLLKERENSALKEVQNSHEELKSLAKYNHFLHQALIYSMNNYKLNKNIEYTRKELDDSLFVVEGWVPENKREALKDLVAELGIVYEEVQIEPFDVIPTYLENKGTALIGEDLVHVYDTPSFRDKDPSLWVLFSFAFFFAFIVNDAGYGLVFLLFFLWLQFKFKSVKGAGARFLKMGIILSVSCILWGVLNNGYFGIHLSLDNPLRKVSVMNWLVEKKIAYHIEQGDETYKGWVAKYPSAEGVKDPKNLLGESINPKTHKSELLDNEERNIFLELSLFVGVVHLSLSMMRYAFRHWSNFGWILVLIGGYLYFPFYLKATSLVHYAFGVPASFGETEGLQLLAGGFILAVVLGIIQHKLLGLAEAMHAVQLFADVLSYLRLYALGLAALLVASTINEIADAVPFFVAIVLISASHVINMMLGIMLGTIHGLRLNFLEWYRYSFEGGGVPFDPLRLQQRD